MFSFFLLQISWDWRANEDVAIKIVWRVNGESEWNRRKLMTSTQDFKTLKNDVILNETSPEFMLCLNSRKKRIWLHIIIPKRTLKNLLLFRNCKKYEPLLTIMYIKRKLHFQTTIIIPTHFYEQTPTPHEQFFPPQSKLYCEWNEQSILWLKNKTITFILLW